MKYKRYIIVMSAIIIFLNLAAWISPALCDWYVVCIFPIWVNIFARFMNIFSFSVGEIMIVIAIILTLIVVILGICIVFLGKKKAFLRRTIKFYKMVGVIFLTVCLIITLNYSVLYHCSPLDPNKMKESREYTLTELEILRNFIVEQCNAYAELMERDEEENVIYRKDMQLTAKEALWGLSEEYPRLAGYYPDVKYIYHSAYMSQANIAGVYYSFSLEANCNGKMYITNYPSTFCHELAHLHGYSFEDEAEFLSYLACINSEDVFFQYSGYLAVLNYLERAYQDSLFMSGSKEEWARYRNQPERSLLVANDCIFLKEETWEEIEEHSLISTKKVDEISTTVIDTSLKANGVEEGIAAYNGVVGLLLQYYDGILY